tara:strand:+ start:141 stop:785 length:645 start_codon:yes stop_codon:yes gene_type:complete
MIKLYYDPITVNCRKVLAGFDLASVPYESVKMDYFGGEHKQPDYLAVNPNGAIPALTDGDFVLWESNAMLQYGADLVGASTVYPTDVRTRADINRWLLWEASAWFPSCYVYLVENLVKPFLGDQPDPAVLEGEQERFDLLASILEARVSGQSFIMGDTVTLADIAVASPMHLHAYIDLPLGPYPAITAWMTRIEALPCWQNTDVVPLLGLDAQS